MISSQDEMRARALHYAAETRRFEIERFWQRSLFYWGFIAAAFVGYTALSDPKYDPLLRQVISAFGIVGSLAWTLQNRGSKYWQEAWEAKVRRLEKEVLGVRLWGQREEREKKGFWGGWQYSASRLTILLSDITVVTWLALAGVAFFVRFDAEPEPKAITVAVVAVGFCAMLLILGRSGKSGDEEETASAEVATVEPAAALPAAKPKRVARSGASQGAARADAPKRSGKKSPTKKT